MVVKPVPCAHIAAFYDLQWKMHPSIGANFLRFSYLQWAEGRPTNGNNLYVME